MTFRVCFDLWPVSDRFGVWRYATTLLSRLLDDKTCSDNSIVVTCGQEQRAPVDRIAGGRCEVVSYNSRRSFLRINEPLSRFVQEHADAYFTPDYLGVMNHGVPAAVTIHDVLRLELPEYGYSTSQFVESFGMDEVQRMNSLSSSNDIEDGTWFSRILSVLQRRTIDCCESVCVPSIATRDSLLRRWPDIADKIWQLPAQFDANMFLGEVGDNHFEIPDLYFLCVLGSNRPHKRGKEVIEAYVLSDALRNGYSLVCVGDIHVAAKLPGVIEIGRCSDIQLARLYRSCAALIVGSRIEGVCLPVLEAIGFGAEMILPRIAAILESSEGRGIFYDPDRFDELTAILSSFAQRFEPQPVISSPEKRVDLANLWWSHMRSVFLSSTVNGNSDARQFRAL